jgi:hypothetical protein
MGERDHHGHASVREAEEVKAFKLSTKRAGADIFNRPNALIGVDDFIADLE